MNVLIIKNQVDVSKSRINYTNYWGVIDLIGVELNCNKVITTQEIEWLGVEKFEQIANQYDIVICPMKIRFSPQCLKIFSRSKKGNSKYILFDDDCYKSEFTHSFYQKFDLIFYRCLDSQGNKPNKGFFWKWSVNDDIFNFKAGGDNIIMNCNCDPEVYPERDKIVKTFGNTGKQLITVSNLVKEEYRKLLTNSKASFVVPSKMLNNVMGKIQEFAISGTAIICPKLDDIDLYYPVGSYYQYDSFEELEAIIKYINSDDSETDLKQKTNKAYKHCINNHTDKIRANELINEIKKVL